MPIHNQHWICAFLHFSSVFGLDKKRYEKKHMENSIGNISISQKHFFYTLFHFSFFFLSHFLFIGCNFFHLIFGIFILFCQNGSAVKKIIVVNCIKIHFLTVISLQESRVCLFHVSYLNIRIFSTMWDVIIKFRFMRLLCTIASCNIYMRYFCIKIRCFFIY